MHVSRAAHTQVGASDESPACIVEVYLRLDRDLHGDVKRAQHRLAPGLCPLVGCLVGTPQRPNTGTTALEQTLHHGAIDVAQRHGGVEDDDEVQMSEVARTAKQD